MCINEDELKPQRIQGPQVEVRSNHVIYHLSDVALVVTVTTCASKTDVQGTQWMVITTFQFRNPVRDLNYYFKWMMYNRWFISNSYLFIDCWWKKVHICGINVLCQDWGCWWPDVSGHMSSSDPVGSLYIGGLLFEDLILISDAADPDKIYSTSRSNRNNHR